MGENKTYIVYAQIEFEIEAESREAASDEAVKKFKATEKLGLKVSGGKVADKNTGYFV